MQIRLSERQKQVLGATVRQYIATARPVGSEAIVDEFNPRVSSATIRNAMGFLEKAGLLYQPYTSAGRVPSDSGYRIYVDRFVKPSDTVARNVDRIFATQLDIDGSSFEAIIREAAQILSTLSGYIALISMPQASTSYLRHLQLVPMALDRIMLIIVLDSGETQSTMISLPHSPEHDSTDADTLDRELQILSNFLNAHLRGRSLLDIAVLDWRELGEEFERYGHLLQSALAELKRLSQAPMPTQLLISGVAEVLRRQPEFSEVQQVQTILHLLESEQDQLWSLIFDTQDDAVGKRVMVRIGAENPLEPIRTCALVSATYHRGEIPVGSVGMLGPTRMVYENAIALVETTADYLSDALSQTM